MKPPTIAGWLVPSLLLAVVAPGCSGLVDGGGSGRSAARVIEPVVGLPCEGCETVFDGLPGAPPTRSRIAPAGEPGEAMRIEGTVFDPAGRPAAGVIVYAYHTDARGLYPTDDSRRGRAAHRHGRLRGWATSDAQGGYSFATVRPAGYPGTEIPAHVHMHVIEVGRCTYYIDDVLFDDDPRLTPDQRRRLDHGRGGSGVASVRRDGAGTWVVRRDIFLGRGIAGYPALAVPRPREAQDRPGRSCAFIDASSERGLAVAEIPRLDPDVPRRRRER